MLVRDLGDVALKAEEDKNALQVELQIVLTTMRGISSYLDGSPPCLPSVDSILFISTQIRFQAWMTRQGGLLSTSRRSTTLPR